MLQVRFGGATAAIAGLTDEERQMVFAEFEALRDVPGVLDGNQLREAGCAATVRVRDGEVEVAPGPAGDPGSALDGYYLYDAPDLDAAVALAARIPVARLGGSVEVRPLFAR